MDRKKILVFCITLLLVVCFSGSLVFAATSISKGSSSFKCLAICRNQAKESYTSCRTEYKEDVKECREEYKECISNSKEDPNKRLHYALKKKCREEYRACKKSAYSAYKDCTKKVVQDYKECKNKCKECIDLYKPVCGVDENTYPNECVLKKAGVKKDCDGECPCIKLCWSNNDCFDSTDKSNSPNRFCEFEGCAIETGVCVDIPENCPLKLWDPVCGCDDKTYPNECVMHMNKVSKKVDGECKCAKAGEIPGQEGCCQGLTKVADAKPDQENPDTCLYMDHYICLALNDNVCGEGENWCNSEDCEKPNICYNNDDCISIEEDGKFCLFEEGNCEGTGECVDIPRNCPYFYEPVCGCDDKTYGNACLAAANKVSINHKGECEVVCKDGNCKVKIDIS